MARQARVRVGGRPQGRSGIDEFVVISSLLAREDLRVGAAPEMHDALFRTNSAVILPEGEDPAKTQSGTRALTSVGLFSTLLRYNEEHPSHIDASGKEVRKKLLIAGHSDTKGSDQFNQPLSEERAKVTLALLTGGQKGRDDFAKLCMARHDGIDLTQIFHWVADSSDFNFQCKPTRWDQTPSTTTITNFKKAYNAAFDEKFKDMEGAKRFPAENGTQDAALWGAIFDCYEYGLRCELGDMETSTEGTDELKRLRGMLTWVDANHQSMGFGERFPVDELTKKDVRSQSNRRVEIMMFDEGEEPDLAAAVADPEVMETYLPGAYGKVPVKPMETARRRTINIYLHDTLRQRLPDAVYELHVLDSIRGGRTDASGRLEAKYPPGTPDCEVFWEPISSFHPPDGDWPIDRLVAGEKHEFLYRRTFDLTFRPHASVPDRREAELRLKNLGYAIGAFDSAWSLFEQDYQLGTSAPLSQATFERLVDVHDGGLPTTPGPAAPVPSTDSADPDDFEPDDFPFRSIEIEMVDADGLPMANERFAIVGAQGVIFEGNLDPNGHATVGVLPSEPLELVFPDHDDSAWDVA